MQSLVRLDGRATGRVTTVPDPECCVVAKNVRAVDGELRSVRMKKRSD